MTGRVYYEAQSQREFSDGEVRSSESVSTVPIFEDEIDEKLELQVALHRLAGWTTTFNEETGVLVARKTVGSRTVVRTVWIVESDPATDGATSC